MLSVLQLQFMNVEISRQQNPLKEEEKEEEIFIRRYCGISSIIIENQLI